MPLNTGQWIVIGICAILIAGYAYGFYTNRRLAQQVVIWLHSGLTRWGRVTAGARLGGMATGGRLNVHDANAPFQAIETLFILSPRENLIFWLFDRLRGQQDTLILKINLRSAPRKNILLEAGCPGEKSFQQAMDKEKLSLIDTRASRLQIAMKDKDTPLSEPLNRFIDYFDDKVIRLSIGKHAPHVVIRANLIPLLNHPMEDLLSSIRQIFILGNDDNRESKPAN